MSPYTNKWVYLYKLLEVRDEVLVNVSQYYGQRCRMPGFSHADHMSFLTVANQASDTQGTIADDVVYW